MIAELSCALARGNYCIINAARQVMAEGAEEASRQSDNAAEGGAMRTMASGTAGIREICESNIHLLKPITYFQFILLYFTLKTYYNYSIV